MNDVFAAAMRRAMHSTRALDLMEATREIQNALSGRSASEMPRSTTQDVTPPPSGRRPAPFTIDPDAEVIEASTGTQTEETAKNSGNRTATKRLRKPLAETLKILREGQFPGVAAGLQGRAQPPARPTIPDGARFVTRSFNCAAGSRAYKLYVPASAQDRCWFPRRTEPVRRIISIEN
uniref:hypothetical protein n=1 Tax=uncultured Rhizobium sp. TaxID=155567 RepID=UPI002602907B|nr:hypothetical protein [uncultured Rhizobium sp.]